MMTTPTRVAVYARTASDDLAANGVKQQLLAPCLQKVKRERDWKVVEIYFEGAVSGALPFGGPELRNLLAAVSAGDVDLVVARDID